MDESHVEPTVYNRRTKGARYIKLPPIPGLARPAGGTPRAPIGDERHDERKEPGGFTPVARDFSEERRFPRVFP